MKFIPPVVLLLLTSVGLIGQTSGIQDTILIQTFTVDPSDSMLIFPSGNDLQWVNWDADNLPTQCGSGSQVPGNWYWESDLGDQNDPPQNSAFTSCSWLEDETMANENWLITPPIYVADSTTVLSWRSLSFEGPGFMDGYKILVSTSTNEPFTGAFTDTIFVAAEMISALDPGSLDPSDYILSPGYVHANWYTDTAYFYLASPGAPTYQGRLEPHLVYLSDYVGQSIYIAFLHDSTNDNIMQLDDITIIHGYTSSAPIPEKKDLFLEISPNPATTMARVSWQTESREAGRLLLTNLFGETLLEHALNDLSTGSFQLTIQQIPAGLYPCTLQTAGGRQTVLLVKQ
jgi:hypothetical protein